MIDEEHDEADPLLTFHHVRTASVILPSGDRVRRKVSLMSIEDESPFEEDEGPAGLRAGSYGSRNVFGYSSIAPSFVSREMPMAEEPRWHRIQSWIRSEELKR
jgi:hypothetical protein